MDEGRSIDLGHYGAVLRRKWKIVVAGVVLGVLLAVAYLVVMPTTATATAAVNVNVISSSPFDSQKPDSQLLDTQTEVQVASSSHVLGAAADELGIDKTLTQMRASTTVQPVAGATVVKISYSAPTRAEAVAGADAIANAYLDYREQAASSKVSTVVDRLNRQLDNLHKQLTQANKRIDSATVGSPVAVQAESDRELINIELTSLVSQINTLDSVDTGGGSLLSSADENAVTYSPSAKLVLGGGALLGLLVGIVAAFVVNATDRRIADGRALSTLGGGEILSVLRSRKAAVPAEGPDLDQIRALRERLLASVGPGGNIVVMDLVIRDRPSDIAINLALSLVERSGPVRLVLPDHTAENVELLVRALDLRSVETSSGTSSYTSGSTPGLEVVVTQENQELGAPGARLGNILSLTQRPDLTTVVAMPPRASRSLWLTAGRLGHSIILVAARRETRVSAVRQRVKELEAVGAVIHGSVLVPRRRAVEIRSTPRRPVVTVAEVDEAAPVETLDADPGAPATAPDVVEQPATAEPSSELAEVEPDEAAEPAEDDDEPIHVGHWSEDEHDVPLEFDEDSAEDPSGGRRGVTSGRS